MSYYRFVEIKSHLNHRPLQMILRLRHVKHVNSCRDMTFISGHCLRILQNLTSIHSNLRERRGKCWADPLASLVGDITGILHPPRMECHKNSDFPCSSLDNNCRGSEFPIWGNFFDWISSDYYYCGRRRGEDFPPHRSIYSLTSPILFHQNANAWKEGQISFL